ncbi:MAG TPA: vitamin K epoxide reductase family protein [Candidatus Limnocylindria bacterium]|nr:vitamin K epoxide reductase family protein [Candidatus Limnocylindria bacterium]
MILSALILAGVGFCISLYIFMLEKKVAANPNYKPACDISDRVSCTKPMKSPYASLLYVSNALVGMGFYVLVGLLALLHAVAALLVVAITGVVASCGLAYLLYFKIRSLCLLCTALYGINLLILLVSMRAF